MGISLQLAEFVHDTRFEDIPVSVVEEQKKSIIDAVGITLGASTLGDGCKDFVEMAEQFASGGSPEATVIGFNKKLPMIWAAFANASMAHSLDYGDTNQRTPLHSNSSTFPTALALAEKLGNVSGKELMTALIVGSETACRVSSAILAPLEKYGFYMPPILTSFGATAAACKLLDLSPKQIVDALSFNLTQTTCSSELTNAPTTIVRSVREAFAAKNALISAFAAKRGLSGFTEPLEGKNGFYHAYARGEEHMENVTKDLGKDYLCESLYFKLWPSCGGTHGTINCLLNIKEKYHPNLEDIQEIHCILHERNRQLVEPLEVKRAPTTSMVGKFSIPYTGAVAMVKGNVTLSSFEPEVFSDNSVKTLASKFTYEVNKDWTSSSKNTVIVTMKDGTKYEYDYVRDLSRTPMDKVVAKMKSCAQYAFVPVDDERLNQIVETIKCFEKLGSVTEFTNLL